MRNLSEKSEIAQGVERGYSWLNILIEAVAVNAASPSLFTRRRPRRVSARIDRSTLFVSYFFV